MPTIPLSWRGLATSSAMVVGETWITGGATCERAVALSPNYAPALAYSSFAKNLAAASQVAIERLSRAFRLSPLDPSLPWLGEQFWRTLTSTRKTTTRRWPPPFGALIHIEMADALRVLVASYYRRADGGR